MDDKTVLTDVFITNWRKMISGYATTITIPHLHLYPNPKAIIEKTIMAVAIDSTPARCGNVSFSVVFDNNKEFGITLRDHLKGFEEARSLLRSKLDAMTNQYVLEVFAGAITVYVTHM
jgi:hypothetical protein